MDTSPILIPNKWAEEVSTDKFVRLLAMCEHAHELETGKCIKNRFGPKCNMDPFLCIEGETPTKKQQEFIASMTSLVNVYLNNWPARSGKSKARLFLAKSIIEGDDLTCQSKLI